MTRAQTVAVLERLTRQWDATVSYLGDESYRVRMAWDGACADGRQTGAHSHDALLTIRRGVITKWLTLSYTMAGVDYDAAQLIEINDMQGDVIRLDSYAGATCFDAVFG